MNVRMLPTTCLLMTLAGVVPAAPAAHRSAEEQAALTSFEALLDGLGRRDKAAMLAHSLRGGQATLMRKGRPVQISLEELAEKASVPGTDTHQETIQSPLVRVDGDVGLVWARFEFMTNGKVDHCGRDLATLVKIDGQWLVAAIEDYATSECGT